VAPVLVVELVEAEPAEPVEVDQVAPV
jgi:hypothetical protein